MCRRAKEIKMRLRECKEGTRVKVRAGVEYYGQDLSERVGTIVGIAEDEEDPIAVALDEGGAYYQGEWDNNGRWRGFSFSNRELEVYKEKAKVASVDKKSSLIAHYSYSYLDRTLKIEFKNGSTFEYINVPREVFSAFESASSLGSFYNKNIKSVYSSRKVVSYENLTEEFKKLSLKDKIEFLKKSVKSFENINECESDDICDLLDNLE